MQTQPKKQTNFLVIAFLVSCAYVLLIFLMDQACM